MPVYAVDYVRNGSSQFLNVVAKDFDEAVATLRKKHPSAQVQSVQDAGQYIRATRPAEATHVTKEGKVVRLRGIKTGNIRALLGKYPSALGIHTALRTELTRRGVRA